MGVRRPGLGLVQLASLWDPQQVCLCSDFLGLRCKMSVLKSAMFPSSSLKLLLWRQWSHSSQRGRAEAETFSEGRPPSKLFLA